MYISSKCCVHVILITTIVHAIYFTMIYSEWNNKLIIKDSKFHTMKSILLQHVKSTVWKEMFQYMLS